MSVDEWVDKCGADIEQHAIQLKKERSTDTCYKVDNPPKHYAMWDKGRHRGSHNRVVPFKIYN